MGSAFGKNGFCLCRTHAARQPYGLPLLRQSACDRVDEIIYARGHFGLCKAKTQNLRQPYRGSSLQVATYMSTGANQDELPSDAAWSSWAEPPDNNANTQVPRNQSTKRARNPQQQARRPNHFFALQVSQSATVTAAIRSVHDSLVQHSQALQPALVEPETAHLTLMVTALENEEEFLHAEAAMDTFAGELAADEGWAEPMALSLEGLSHFRHQVQEARSCIWTSRKTRSTSGFSHLQKLSENICKHLGL
ncbi:A-kinase anchor protein 7 isoforms alpha and beta [Trebouxia sp. C0010 RCD-2024]